MKFNLCRPPEISSNNSKELLEISEWLYMLWEKLDVTLSNLSEENFSPALKEKISRIKEDKNDNV